MGLYAYLEKPEKTFRAQGSKIHYGTDMFCLFKDLCFAQTYYTTKEDMAAICKISMEEFNYRQEKLDKHNEEIGISTPIYPLKNEDYYLVHEEINYYGALHFGSEDIYSLFNYATLTTKKGLELVYYALLPHKKEGFKLSIMDNFIEGEHFVKIS